MQYNEQYISNEERDRTIPADVVVIIDTLRNLPITRNLTLEQMYAVDAQLLSGARAIQREYGADAKFSYSWHKLAGSSVEHKGEMLDKDRVREIDDAVHTFVRDTLAPFLDRLMSV
jgi:hypothetical protein